MTQPMIGHLSYWLALMLSLGSLLIYLSGAIWLRLTTQSSRDPRFDFNLGIPKANDEDKLFATALVSSGTSLSTVFLFFLGSGRLFGIWLLLCPILFGAGNWLMFFVYRRALHFGYFQASSSSSRQTGLIPFLAMRLTNNESVGWSVTLMSVLNLMAVLVLELVVGVDVIGYLASNTLMDGKQFLFDFPVFAISIILLLGYVFVGGFRAVVASDVWQMKAMCWAIALTIAAFVLINPHLVRTTHWDLSPVSSASALFGFIISAALGNIFIPLSQESSWQRFRAFSESSKVNLKKAMCLSVRNASLLWLGLIILSFLIRSATPDVGLGQFSGMSGVLEALRTINDSAFPFFVFPIMTVAALSAMYSTSDTSVSAMLYLLEYRREGIEGGRRKGLPFRYYFSMVGLFLAATGAYMFVRVWFHPSILQLVFSVFSNLVVVAPTVLSAAIMPPANSGDNGRGIYVLTSIGFGLVAFWLCTLAGFVLGSGHLWLNQLAILVGLVAALLPMMPLWYAAFVGGPRHA
jgi:hypothetical protein